MKNINFIIILFVFLCSCSLDKSKNLDVQNVNLDYMKFTNIKNRFSYEEYKLLIINYGTNKKFPDISSINEKN